MNSPYAVMAFVIGVTALLNTSCGRPNHAQETKANTAETVAGFEALGKLPRKADKRVKEVYYDTWDAAKEADKHAAAVLREQEREFQARANREGNAKNDKAAQEAAEELEARRALDERTRLEKIIPGGEGLPKVKKTFFSRKYVVVEQ